MSVLAQPRETRHPDGQQGAEVAARRRAQVVAVAAGLGVPVWFWLTLALWDLSPTPEGTAAPSAYVEFYVENDARLAVHATAFVILWVLLLVLVVAVVRACTSRPGLTATLAITLAGASTAGAVLIEGVLAWPAMTPGIGPGDLAASLDPAVAQALVLSRDGLHAPVASLLGVALMFVAVVLARSDVWGHRTMAAVTAAVGAFGASSMLLGPESLGPVLVTPWGVVMGAVFVVDLRRRSVRMRRDRETSSHVSDRRS
jgi:hypothetical protein